MRRTTAQRVAQCEGWLRQNFKPPRGYVVRVRWYPKLVDKERNERGEREELQGRHYSWERKHEIQLSRRLNRRVDDALETLLHEWAHVLVARVSRDVEDVEHPDEYWLAYGRIYREWFDCGGWDESHAIEV